MFYKFSLRSNRRAARLSAIGSVGFIAAILLVAAPLRAADLHWQFPSGNWNGPHWGGVNTPQSTDNAYINNGGTATVTTSGDVCSNLYVGDPSSAAGGAVQISDGGLSTSANEYVGNHLNGTGTITQTGGANSVFDWLYLGYASGSNGSYSLSGSGYLSVAGETYPSYSSYSQENVGYSGSGTFAHSGGTNICYYLSVGGLSSGSGAYGLSGSGYLSVTYQENVGDYGAGTFMQSGGTNSCGYLNVGNNYGSGGAFNLSGGSLYVSNNANIGYDATGTFTQTGGTHNIGEFLYLGYYGSGTYNLGGSGYLSASGTFASDGSTSYGEENLGYFGSGTFTQSGGTNSCINLSIVNGAYVLSGNGYLSVNQANGNTQENVGDSGTGTFTQSGGTNSCGYLNIGNGFGSVGTYNLSGSGYLSASSTFSAGYSQENVGSYGKGTFTQSGGTNSCSSLILGLNNGSGTYNLNGGLLIVASLGQGSGTAAFNFSGGTLQAGSGFSSDLPMTLSTSGGGATFDTSGNSASLSGSLTGPGSLTLNDSLGSGRLILSASNTYTGGTYVQNGRLIVTNPYSLEDGTNLTVGDAGMFTQVMPSLAANSSAPSPVPEPGTLVLLAAVLAVGFGVRWRK